MTVYIDDAFISAKVGRIASRWCHLFAAVGLQLWLGDDQ